MLILPYFPSRNLYLTWTVAKHDLESIEMVPSWEVSTGVQGSLFYQENLPRVSCLLPVFSLCFSPLCPLPSAAPSLSPVFWAEFCMDRMGRVITGWTEMRWPLLRGPQCTCQHFLGNGSFPENSALLRRKQHFKVNPGLITSQAPASFNSMFQQRWLFTLS